jgi:protein required for attachment to host cells
MKQCCVIVADEARARFFTIDYPPITEVSQDPKLVERADLTNPESHFRGEGTYSNSRVRNRVPLGGSAHGYTDHRTGHAKEVLRRFARRVIKLASELTEREEIHRLVFVAPPDFLGELREQGEGALLRGLEHIDFAEELTLRSQPQIEAALRRHGVLPEREFVTGIRGVNAE